MNVFWHNAALCFRADTKKEDQWLSDFYRMLEGGKLVIEPIPDRGSDSDNQESVLGIVD